MNICNIESVKGVEELKRSVIKNPSRQNLNLFYATVDRWITEYDRLPNADEFPPNVGVDSLQVLQDKLKLKNLGEGFAVENKRLIEYTGKETTEEMVHVLGDLHKDYNFNIVQIDENSSIIEATKRPTEEIKIVEEIPDLPISERAVGHLLDRISTLHGINLYEITNKDIALDKSFPNGVMLKGFIRDGNIYINTDNSTPNTPIHELMHMFMGGIRFQNPYLYQNLLSTIAKDPALVYKMNQYRNRTEMDRAEEVLVEEMSNYLIGKYSILEELPDKDKYEVDYNIRRLLDSMLDGDFSNRIIPEDKLYSSTLAKVAKIVNSREVFNNMTGTMSESFVHRVLSNQKEDLLKSGKLKEVC